MSDTTFSWPRPDLDAGHAGFTVVDGFTPDHGDPIRILAYPLNGQPTVYYDPLGETPELFLIFGDLARSGENECLSFANLYGHLELRHRDGNTAAWLRPFDRKNRDLPIHGEPIQPWLTHALRITTLVELGLALREKKANEDTIRAYVLQDAQRVALRTTPNGQVLSDWFDVPSELEPTDLGKLLLRHVFEEQLQPLLHVEIPSPKRRPVYLQPQTLLDCIYLQAATALGNGSAITNCEICGKPMVVKPKKGPSRTTCSEPCRLKAYRQRSGSRA